MTAGDHSGADHPITQDADAAGSRRSMRTIAYVAATVLGGLGALVLVVMELGAQDGRTFQVLAWVMLAVLMFGSAAYRWWRGGHAEHRSGRVARAVEPAHISEAVEGAGGEADAVRRLRRAHPGLGLREAVDLVRDHGARGPHRVDHTALTAPRVDGPVRGTPR